MNNAIWQLIVLIGPLFLCVVALGWIESKIQRRMTKHFGWRSNLWTGWIGAPVHEYSHAIAAWMFGHEVKKIVPFRPEEKTGRLGYVEIGHNPASRWQTFGHFVVCYAPLLGGTTFLLLLTLLFFPSALQTKPDIETTALLSSSFDQAMQQLGAIVTMENLGTIRFWIFSYLVLAVSCHIAPSREDVNSSLRSLPWVLIVFIVCAGVFVLVGGLPDSLFRWVAPFFFLLQANFYFGVMLCLMAFTIVYIITEMITWLS